MGRQEGGRGLGAAPRTFPAAVPGWRRAPSLGQGRQGQVLPKPRGDATPSPAKGREGEEAKVRKKPELAAPAAAGVSRRRSGMGMDRGSACLARTPQRGRPWRLPRPLRFPGEGGEGGAAAAARAHKRGAPGVRPQRGRPRAPGPGRGLRRSSRPDRLRPGVRATAASGGGRDIGAAQGSKCSANSFPTGGLPWFRK